MYSAIFIIFKIRSNEAYACIVYMYIYIFMNIISKNIIIYLNKYLNSNMHMHTHKRRKTQF